MSTEEDGAWYGVDRYERWMTPEDKRKARDKARKAERAGLPKRKKVQYIAPLIQDEDDDPFVYERRKSLLRDITAGLKRGEIIDTGLPVEYIPYIDLPKPALDTIKTLAKYLDIEWDEEIHTITGALKTYREQRYGDAAPVFGILRGRMPDGTIVWWRRKTGFGGKTVLIIGNEMYPAHKLAQKLKGAGQITEEEDIDPMILKETEGRVDRFVHDPFRDIKSGFTADMFNVPGDYKDED